MGGECEDEPQEADKGEEQARQKTKETSPRPGDWCGDHKLD